MSREGDQEKDAPRRQCHGLNGVLREGDREKDALRRQSHGLNGVLKEGDRENDAPRRQCHCTDTTSGEWPNYIKAKF